MGWVKIQEQLEGQSQWSRIYTIFFIWVIIQNLQEAQEDEKTIQDVKKASLFHKKKAFILEKQKRDLEILLEGHAGHGRQGAKSFDEFLKTLAGKLNHNDILPMQYLACDRAWMETYLDTLQFHEASMLR